MVTKSDLLEYIYHGENSGIEFKRDVLENYALAKELVAFSNFAGGMVLLGVDDDGIISGITRDRLEDWIITVCRDKIRPAINPYLERIKDVEPGKDVVIVRVLRGYSVHSQYHNNKNTYYIRVGSQIREPTTEELARLFKQRSMLRIEMQTFSGSTFNDLDLRRLKDYFGRIRQQHVPSENNITEWQTLLVNTGIMSEEGVTVSGILLFGKVPNRFLPYSGIDAIAFPGNEKDYAAIERTKLRGPMTPLLNAEENVIENGLVEQAVEFAKRNTGTTARLIDGARRIEHPAYPEVAVREAIINALIHRDYLLIHTDIELAIYQDRMEIISPGKLPSRITPDRMRTGLRVARNELLKDVMRDYQYLEHMGMGIPRKIIHGMYEHNKTEPDLIENGERFLIRLYSKPNSEQ